jgi:hypothetical protein
MFGEIGRTFNAEDKVTIITFRDVTNTFITGSTFIIHGFEFVLFLDEGGLDPGKVHFLNKDGSNQPIYRPRNMNSQIGKHVSHTIKFLW